MAEKGKELDGSPDGCELPEGPVVLHGTPGDEPEMKQVLDVLSIEKSYRLKLGVALYNKDGSMTVILNAFPCNRRLRIQPKAQSAGNGSS